MERERDLERGERYRIDRQRLKERDKDRDINRKIEREKEKIIRKWNTDTNVAFVVIYSPF